MGQPWLLGPGSQLLQVAPAEDSHSPLLGPGPTYKGQEEMPSRHYKNVCRLERKGTEGPWPSHVASAAQRARQTDTQTPVLCSQSLQGLRPSRGHLGRSWGTGVGKESIRISGVGPLPQDGLCSWKQMASPKPSLLKACMLQGPADHTVGAPGAASHTMPLIQLSVQGGRAAAWKGEEYHHPNLTSAPDLEKGYCWNPNAQTAGLFIR